MRKLILLLALSSTPALAAPLRWADVRALGLERSPQLKGAGLRENSSRAELKSTYGNFLPDVTLNASRTRRVDELGTTENKDRRAGYGITASWNLFAGFATVAETRRARASYEGAQADRDLTSSDLRRDLRRAFFDVAYQQDRIALYERILKRLEQNYRLISLKYENGTEARWNVQKNEADRARAEFNLLNARNGLRTSRDRLAQLLFLDALPAEDVAPTPVEEIQLALGEPETLVQNHPAIRKAGAEAEVADRARTTARASFLPSLDLVYSRTTERPLINDRVRANSNAVALNANWNIFNGLTDFYKVQQANLRQEAAELDRVGTNRRVLTEIRTAFLNFDTSRASVPSLRALREAAEERVRTVSAQYRAGLKTYLEWDEAQRSLTEAQENEVNAIHDALLSLAEAERAAGRTLEEP